MSDNLTHLKLIFHSSFSLLVFFFCQQPNMFSIPSQYSCLTNCWNDIAVGWWTLFCGTMWKASWAAKFTRSLFHSCAEFRHIINLPTHTRKLSRSKPFVIIVLYQIWYFILPQRHVGSHSTSTHLSSSIVGVISKFRHSVKMIEREVFTCILHNGSVDMTTDDENVLCT